MIPAPWLAAAGRTLGRPLRRGAFFLSVALARWSGREAVDSLTHRIFGNMPFGQERAEQGKKEAPTVSEGRFKVRPVGAERPVAPL